METGYRVSLMTSLIPNGWNAPTHAPAINVVEHDTDYCVELAAPGMTKDDFRVHLGDEDNLVISMEKKTENNGEQKDGRYLRREFSYSQFQQTMVLPDDVDKEHISAHVEHGVLCRSNCPS